MLSFLRVDGQRAVERAQVAEQRAGSRPRASRLRPTPPATRTRRRRCRRRMRSRRRSAPTKTRTTPTPPSDEAAGGRARRRCRTGALPTCPRVRHARLGRPDIADYRMGVTFTNVGAAVRRARARPARGISTCTIAAATSATSNSRPTAAPGCWCRPSSPARRRPRPACKVGDRLLGGRRQGAADDAQETRRSRAGCWPTRSRGSKFAAADRARRRSGRRSPSQLRRRPLEVIRPEAENVAASRRAAPRRISSTPPSFLLTLQQVDDQIRSPPTARSIAGVDLLDRHLADRRPLGRRP